MINQELLLGIIAVTIILLGTLLAYLKKSFSKKTLSYLYEQNDPIKYIESLLSFKAKFLVSNNQRLMLLINGYTQTKEYEKIYEIFKDLRNSKLSYGKKISLYQKEIFIYLKSHKNDLAIKSYNDLNEQANLLQENTEIRKLVEDANIMVNVYARKNLDYINELKEIIQNSKEKALKGLCNYRIAYIYYYNDDPNNADKYLKESNNMFKNTLIETAIRSVIKNKNNFKNTII